MFIIVDKKLKNMNVQFKYFGEIENQNWIKLTDKEHAKRFETEQEAKAFMKANKVKGELELL